MAKPLPKPVPLSSLPSYVGPMLRAAVKARKNAYAPYSSFPVGAAVRMADGKIYAGCNVEEGAFTSICAEQNAIGSAVAAGGRKLITTVVIVGGQKGDGLLCVSCGRCRQWLREHSNEKLQIVVAGPESLEEKTVRLVTTLGVVLPFSFGPENLSTNKSMMDKA